MKKTFAQVLREYVYKALRQEQKSKEKTAKANQKESGSSNKAQTNVEIMDTRYEEFEKEQDVYQRTQEHGMGSQFTDN